MTRYHSRDLSTDNPRAAHIHTQIHKLPPNAKSGIIKARKGTITDERMEKSSIVKYHPQSPSLGEGSVLAFQVISYMPSLHLRSSYPPPKPLPATPPPSP